MAEGKAKVNTSAGLNVRAGAGTGYSKLGALVNGTQVTYYAETNGWLQIKYNGQTGYISKQYTTITQGLTSGGGSTGSTGGDSGATSGASGTVKVTASDGLNVRKGNSTSYGIIGCLTYGTVVSYSGEKDGWLKITYAGQTGWICKAYTKKTDGGSTGGGNGGGNTGGEPVTQTTKMYTTASDGLNVRKGPGTGYGAIGMLSYGSEIAVISTESNGWKKISYNGGVAYVSGSYVSEKKPTSGGGGGSTPSGTNPAKFAETYLYSVTGLYTHDFITKNPKLKYLNDVSYGKGYNNNGYNNNCANFVCACQQNCGWMNYHNDNVGDLYAALKGGKCGYRVISKSQAKAGDIWCNTSLGHTELVYSNVNGSITLIGSNNGGTKYQRVTKDGSSGSSGYFLSRQ